MISLCKFCVKIGSSMLSSTFHEHAILKLAPVLHSFSSSTATAEYADPHFPFHVLYIYIYKNSEKKNGKNLCSVFCNSKEFFWYVSLHWFPREMTSEKRAQKFHTDDASPPRSGSTVSALVSQVSFRGETRWRRETSAVFLV